MFTATIVDSAVWARMASRVGTTLSQATANAAPLSASWIGQLLGRVERVALDDDRAEAHHGVEGDDVLRAVGQDQRDAVAACDPEVPKCLCGAGDLVAEFPVGGRGTVEVEGDAVREPLDGGVEEVAQALVGHLDLGRHAVGVAGRARVGRSWRTRRSLRRWTSPACHGRTRCAHQGGPLTSSGQTSGSRGGGPLMCSRRRTSRVEPMTDNAEASHAIPSGPAARAVDLTKVYGEGETARHRPRRRHGRLRPRAASPRSWARPAPASRP